MEHKKIELTSELQEIFDNIMRDSKFTGRSLQSKHKLAEYYLEFPEYQEYKKKLEEDTKREEEKVREFRKNNPNLSDEEFYQEVLTNYGHNIIETIKKEYQGLLPVETLNKLNNFKFVMINDPERHGDMEARFDTGEVWVNMANHALDRDDIVGKIVRSMGSMTHELFHFIYRMLKDRNMVDEKMIYDLANGDKAIGFGMVGHMLNEGFVEKKSIEFCERNNIYHTISPSYIQFTKLCEYIQKVSGIDEKFLLENNYEAILNLFTPEAREAYQRTERFEYREKFPLTLQSGGKRKILEDEVLSSHNEKNNVPYINPDVYVAIKTFSKLAKYENQEEINKLVYGLSNMHVNDTIDRMIVILNEQLRAKRLNLEDIKNNTYLLTKINPKYQDFDSLVKRLEWLREMNIMWPEMPLSENHKLAVEAFDEFNELLQGKFDCFYTGGIMGYLNTSQSLERYHSDLDLFINEGELESLKALVEESSDFEFVSNMEHKEANGHEYKVVYKDTPMSIGLFLFARGMDNSITKKEYFYRNQDVNNDLLVSEKHFSKEYTDLSFDGTLRNHNGIPYRSMSLESIYNSKKDARPKDRYDAQKIAPFIDKRKEEKIEELKPLNTEVKEKVANDSVVKKIEHSKKLEKGPSLALTKPKTSENGGHINIIGLSLLILLAEIITFVSVYFLIKK